MQSENRPADTEPATAIAAAGAQQAMLMIGGMAEHMGVKLSIAPCKATVTCCRLVSTVKPHACELTEAKVEGENAPNVISGLTIACHPALFGSGYAGVHDAPAEVSMIVLSAQAGNAASGTIEAALALARGSIRDCAPRGASSSFSAATDF